MKNTASPQAQKRLNSDTVFTMRSFVKKKFILKVRHNLKIVQRQQALKLHN